MPEWQTMCWDVYANTIITDAVRAIPEAVAAPAENVATKAPPIPEGIPLTWYLYDAA